MVPYGYAFMEREVALILQFLEEKVEQMGNRGMEFLFAAAKRSLTAPDEAQPLSKYF